MRIYSSGRREESAVFPGAETSAAEGRRWLRKILGDHPRRDDAVLLLSELLTNAVLHTTSTELHATVLIDWDAVIHLKVADQGAPTSPCLCRPQPDPLTESGRGIHLVRNLSHRWGFLKDTTGCVVWLTLDPHNPPDPPTSHRAVYQEARCD
ncbi:hypothetical protein GCM10009677_29520 [Sphaerisporangium rubeum]|uniref:Anti-sigma regulatory factor (Ser/Thr protein kinase) n=1 Tax=Sphaerisporangium rubeum TaxID=321317 RepID=A0A7X0IFP0_9ACTN|nr:ATP-binding protein [Sphaerisporangium rubeum]MBB6473709.1 anti-sigma regulatory factor (Ser/Thr protein kinase) [Sphaerisporangium rubeum]